MGKYSERCEAEGIIFILLVVDRFGGGHKDSLEVITKLRRHTEVEEEEIMRQLKYLEAMCGLLEDMRVLEVPEVLYLNQVR